MFDFTCEARTLRPSPFNREEFSQFYSVDEETGCWIWSRARTPFGHGRYSQRIDGKTRGFSAHRISYEHYKGPAGNLLVCHVCDNPPCVNPDHLFLGTHADNTQDMLSKGRANPRRGVTHPKAKLTENDVRHIRLSGGSNKAMAVKFGVSAETIRLIRTGIIWRTLPTEAEG